MPAESPGSLGGGLSDFSDEEGEPVPAAGIGVAGLGEPLPACADAITRAPFLSQIACQKPCKNQCSAGSDMWARIHSGENPSPLDISSRLTPRGHRDIRLAAALQSLTMSGLPLRRTRLRSCLRWAASAAWASTTATSACRHPLVRSMRDARPRLRTSFQGRSVLAAAC